jgi:ribosomal protein S18 acetylase RimI-like enzyme
MTAGTRTSQTHPVVIRRAGLEQLDELRPLWEAMQEHHSRVAAVMGLGWSFRSNSGSWARRRASYLGWLEQPDAFVLVASRHGLPVGCLVGRRRSGWTMLDTGERIGWIESLSVLPDQRANGIGHQLLARAAAEFAALGIDTVGLGVLAENIRAIRFDEAHGMHPATVSYLGQIRRGLDHTAATGGAG